MKLNKHQLELFKTLTEMNGISGFETDISRYLKKTSESLGYTLIFDNLGSIFALKKSKNPNAKKVLVVAHMDEVGFMVTSINSQGLIKANPIGGLNDQTLLTSRVILKGSKGDIYGTIVATPPHLLSAADREKPSRLDQMLFDFGFKSKEEALEKGAHMGCMMVMEGKFEELNDGERLLGKAFDDRFGIILGIELLEELKDVELDYDSYIGGSVQEEVGCRGAKTSAALIKPDLAIVLDCSPAQDATGDPNALGKLGEGVLLRVLDRSMIAFPELIDYQIKKASECNAKVQYFISPGGTDAGSIHMAEEGILTFTQCLCARSIHTCSTILDTNDYLDCKKLTLHMLKTLTSEEITKLMEVRK